MPDYSPAEEAAGWLDCLIASYERVRRHDPDAIEDPDATDDMIYECRRLAQRLRTALPKRTPEPTLTQAERDDIPW